jgi:hypothetical protein
MMGETQPTDLDWLRAWQGKASGDWLALALDTLEPLAPLSAQLMWVAQPALGWALEPQQWQSLARALETPEGIETIRRLLREDA